MNTVGNTEERNEPDEPSYLSIDKSDCFGKGFSSGEQTLQIADGKLKEAQLGPVRPVNLAAFALGFELQTQKQRPGVGDANA